MTTHHQRDAREAVHAAARRASERGCCNLPGCAFPRSTSVPRVCSMYCDELTTTLQAAHDAGRASASGQGEAGLRAALERSNTEIERLRDVLDCIRNPCNHCDADEPDSCPSIDLHRLADEGIYPTEERPAAPPTEGALLDEALPLLEEVLAAHDADRPWSPVTTAAIRDVVAGWRAAGAK